MLRTRVMPCLLIKGGGLIKTCNFKKYRYVGDPINAVRIFNQKEVDELIIFDIDASKNKIIQYDLIEQITSECFMPLCYGGGVKNIEDFRKLFYIGVEKVSISSLIFENPSVVRTAIEIFGAQSIIATFDIKKGFFCNKYYAYIYSGKKNTKIKIDECLKLAKKIGVGEIILNSIDRDGTWNGFDLNLFKSIKEEVDVPIVAVGGAGSLEDIKEIVITGGATAVGIGSMTVFQSKGMGVLIKFPTQKELSTLFD
ncbi:imidazole glycerol phosphate synthase subunit HisF [Zooshikella marina]|uniref:AglZ/HisF2 family acetamidino modification protein n=1 Tax=Zooshikella ganghwensis TaxID=202772 RepID=UPI001BAFB8DD|nr:AglZ/HisF2 family acetamidino modification protein [Zooshikella ganghwensis]MBU2704613.1 imidazole glycerol phosphate synthase subunit HisF [Zooshikella ganghwensis]